MALLQKRELRLGEDSGAGQSHSAGQGNLISAPSALPRNEYGVGALDLEKPLYHMQ